ncbi:MAG: hypothetical protein J0M30_01105 [Chitinophagales bacterium]|nr:hypothetical protein [Chitinophagales bacterium]
MKMFYSLLITLVTFTSACKKEAQPEFLPGDKGELVLEFDNIVGGTDLQLNTGVYTNAAGEEFKISMLNYYISNIVLTNEDGTTYTMPRDSSYFLIKEENPSREIELGNVPAGNYTGISFLLGIDSTKNTAPVGERTGCLDPAGDGAGMYWTWNSGYIFLKMEGPADAATSADKKFRYHIGGFGGYSSTTINNIKKFNLAVPAGSRAEVRKDKAHGPVIHILADAAKVMNGSTNVSIAANTTVMFSPYSVNIANNYAGMFSVDHVHND